MRVLVERITGDLAAPFKKFTDYTYGFRIPDTNHRYMLTFDQSQYDEIEVFFKLFNEDYEDGTHDRVDIGMRGAAIVFHTVWAILKDFLDNTLDPIKYVIFAARSSEESRVRFYTTLAKQLAQQYGQDPDDIEYDEDDHRGFHFYRVPVFVTPTEE